MKELKSFIRNIFQSNSFGEKKLPDLRFSISSIKCTLSLLFQQHQMDSISKPQLMNVKHKCQIICLYLYTLPLQKNQ